VLSALPAEAQFVRPPDTGTVVQPKTTFHTTDETVSIAFSPDGKFFACTSARTLQVWEVAGTGVTPKFSMPPNPNGHTGRLTWVGWSPDGKFVASAAIDGKVKLWDATTGNKTAEYDAGAGVTMRGLAFSPDSTKLATSGSGILTLLDGVTLRKLAEVPRPNPQGNEWVWPLRYTADGREIVTASSHNFARFYDATTGRETRHWSGASNAAASTADGHIYVSWSSNVGQNAKVVEIHDGVSGRITATYPVTDDVLSIRISPNNRYAALAELDHTVRLIDISNGHIKATFQGHGNGPNSVAFSPDGTVLASGDASLAYTWAVPP
jgi:WD40 repeat protein